MTSYINLRINFMQELLDIQSKETQLINVLNKIKSAKLLNENLYAIQNFSLIDDQTFVSKLQGDIEVMTFSWLLNKHKNLIENGKQDIKQKEINQQYQQQNISEELKKIIQENNELKVKISDLILVKSHLFKEINIQVSEVQELKHQLEYQSQTNIGLRLSQQLLFDLLNNCCLRITDMEQNISKIIVKLERKKEKEKQKEKNNSEKRIIIQEIQVLCEQMKKQRVNYFEQYEKLKKQTEYQNDIIKRKFQKQSIDIQEQKQQQMVQKISNTHLNDDKNIICQNKSQYSQDTIDICVILDTTQSMDPFKESVIKFLYQTDKSIRSQTNKECNWGIVAYKDIDYLTATRQELYHEIDFNQNIELVCRFIENQEFSHGDDTVEDLQQGIKQALKLSWKSQYKVVLIITDAPCHGLKYHNGETDNFSDKTIEGKLDLLIDQKIFLIGLPLPTNNLKQENYKTKKMFQYFQQYFEENSCLQIIQNMYSHFTKLIKIQAQYLSQTKIKNTILQGGQFQRQNVIYGAVESLSKKMADPIQFDKMWNIQIRQCKFTVHRSEFKQVAFEKYLKDIHKLGNDKDDYNTAKEEDQWNCIVSRAHVAEGVLKKVYLMKNKERDQEVYIIKSQISGQPYQSFDEALKDCRSHLIAKLFMKRFKETCLDLREEKRLKIEIPQIQYSDILILEEDGKQFWIAERNFKGEFVKYNNNNGFIDDSNTHLNNLLQAFSIFTYFESESTMMICDVQGIGPYLTDPAINTVRGGFDCTDIGEEGINNYLINFKQKDIGQEFLELLDIQLDRII